MMWYVFYPEKVVFCFGEKGRQMLGEELCEDIQMYTKPFSIFCTILTNLKSALQKLKKGG